MSTPYIDALRMLARRELSEAQVRQRLARRGHEAAAIDEAVARLTQERALDDERVAAAIARVQTTAKRRGRIRVRRQIEQAGIAPAIARRTVDELFAGLDSDGLIEAALTRRLRPGATITDDRTFQRLYRFLVAQGFDSDQVMRTLSARRDR